MGDLVIGLHGAKGSGKDQFFQIVQRAFPTHSVRKLAYADPIKFQLLKIFQLDDEQQYDEMKRSNVTLDLPSGQLTVDGRHVVREIGMLMRHYDSHQFVRYVETVIKSSPGGTIWFVTDVRFPNEVKSIRDQLNGSIVKIKRPGYEYDGHVTESEVADELCDHIIHNVGTLQDYQQQVEALFTSMMTSLAHEKEYA